MLRKGKTLYIMYGLVMVVLFTSQVSAYIQLNGSGSVFCTDSTPSVNTALTQCPSVPSPAPYIIRGASFYLKAQANYALFLNLVELSGIERVGIREMRRYLEDALVNIQQARENYELLLGLASAVPYDEAALTKLETFDYESFFYTHQLNRDIFDVVAYYLEQGDVVGVYGLVLEKVKEIEYTMSSALSQMEAGKPPSLQTVWRGNELFLETLLFGQYVARVSSEVFPGDQ